MNVNFKVPATSGTGLAPEAFVVAGMHRSGTSALARVLALAGAELPRTLMAPGSDNPKGFWESRRIAEENDRVLEHWGSTWDDVLSFLAPRAVVRDQAVVIERFQAALSDEFSLKAPIVLKEPRMALLLDGWIEALKRSGMRPKVLLPLRNPLEVAASLQERNGFPIGKGLLLWLTYVLSAEASSRGCDRILVTYNSLLDDWRGVLGRCEREFGAAFSRLSPHTELEIDAFVSRADRHHYADDRALEARADVVDWVRRVYACLRDAATPGGVLDTAVLDEVAAAFAGSSRVFSPLIVDLSARLRDTQAVVSRIEGQAARERVQFEILRSELEESQREKIEALELLSISESAVQSRDVQIADLNALQQDTRDLLRATQGDVAERDSRIADLSTLLVETREHLGAAQGCVAERDSRIADLSALLVETREHLGAAQGGVAERDARIIELSAFLAETRETLGATQGGVSERDARIVELTDTISRLHDRVGAIEAQARTYADEVQRHAVFLQESMTPIRRFRRALWRTHFTRLISEIADVAHALPRLGVFAAARALFEIRFLRRVGAFDVQGYLARGWDVAATGQDPIAHFVLRGARELRDPANTFSTRNYLSLYPDVAVRGVNPFVHFLRHGQREGRSSGATMSPPDAVGAVQRAAVSHEAPLKQDIGNPLPLRKAPMSFAPATYSGQAAPLDQTLSSLSTLSSGAPLSLGAQLRPSAPQNPYDVRPDGLVAGEARRGAMFAAEFKLFEPAPNWGEAVDAINAAAGPPVAEDVTASIIVPVYGQLAYTLNCLHALISHKSAHRFEVIVVDDCSPDETREWIPKIRGLRFIRRAANGGFIDACNEGASYAQGRYIVFLNNDTRVVDGWLDELIGSFEAFPNAGLVGSKLFYPDATLQEAGGVIWRDGSAWNYGRNDDPGRPEYCYARQVDYVSGASIAVPRDVWHRVGGFDERYRPAYGEDSDLALRLRHTYGMSVVFQPLSRVIHYEGKTSGTDTTKGVKAYQIDNAKRLFETWAPALASHRPNGEDVLLEKDRGVRKRALVLDATTPAPDEDAGSVTCVGLMTALRDAGFKVTFLAEDNLLFLPEKSAALQRQGIEVVYLPYARSVDHFLTERGGEFDVVLVFRVDVASRRLKKLRSACKGARIVFHASDLHFLREERRLDVIGEVDEKGAVEKLRRHELGVVRAVDAVVVHSTFEAEILHAATPEARVFVWPWVLDPKEMHNGFDERSGVGFLGGYRHPPNVDAVLSFARSIWPLVRARRPDLTFYVAGSEAPAEIRSLHGCDGVEVLGHVDDLSDFFARLRVSVAPIRYGAGIKGKVAMSLAHGVPGVVTTCAAEGMGLEDGDCVIIRDDEEAFASAILGLHDDAAAWTKMSERAQTFVHETYGSALAMPRMKALLELAGARPELLN